MADVFASEAGSGAANGTSPANAWAVSSIPWSSILGDDLYLLGEIVTTIIPNAGGTQESERITIRGDWPGNRGRLFGGVSKGPSDWTNDTGNLWYTPITPMTLLETPKVISWGVFGRLYEQDSIKFCINVLKYQSDDTDKSDLTSQGQVWIDRPNDLFYIYSVDNPSNFYESVYLPEKQMMFYVDGFSYFTLKGLTVSHASNTGLRFRNSLYAIVEDNRVSYCGGNLQNILEPTRSAQGNGVTFMRNSDGLTVRRNHFSQCFDEGCSIQLAGATNIETSNGGLMEDNVCDRNVAGLGVVTNVEFAGHEASVIIRNNIITNCGYGWTGYEKNAHHGTGLKATQGVGGNTYVEAYGNIIDTYAWRGADINGAEVYFHDNLFINGKVDYANEAGSNDKGFHAAIRCISNEGTQDDYDEIRGTIENNLILNQEGSGISIINTTPVEPLVIRNNRIENCGYGVNGDEVFAAIRSTLSNNVAFTRNTVVQNGDLKFTVMNLSNGGLFSESNYNSWTNTDSPSWDYGASTVYESLAAWQSGTGWDTNSTENDPFANTFGTFAVG